MWTHADFPHLQITKTGPDSIAIKHQYGQGSLKKGGMVGLWGVNVSLKNGKITVTRISDEESLEFSIDEI
jgi:hypothetical protein